LNYQYSPCFYYGIDNEHREKTLRLFVNSNDKIEGSVNIYFGFDEITTGNLSLVQSDEQNLSFSFWNTWLHSKHFYGPIKFTLTRQKDSVFSMCKDYCNNQYCNLINQECSSNSFVSTNDADSSSPSNSESWSSSNSESWSSSNSESSSSSNSESWSSSNSWSSSGSFRSSSSSYSPSSTASANSGFVLTVVLVVVILAILLGFVACCCWWRHTTRISNNHFHQHPSSQQYILQQEQSLLPQRNQVVPTYFVPNQVPIGIPQKQGDSIPTQQYPTIWIPISFPQQQ